MKQLKRRIFRERRRLVVFSILAALSGYLIFMNNSDLYFGLAVPVVAALVFAFLLPLVALVLILVFPSYRYALELTGVVMFIYSVLGTIWPKLLTGAVQHPEFVLLGVFVAAQALAFLVYGDWSDRHLRRSLHVERAVVMSDAADRNDVWGALCPTPATHETYWNKAVERISAIADTRKAYMMRYKYPDGKWMDQRIEFDQLKSGKAFRYKFQTLADQRPGAEEPKLFTVNLEKRPVGVTAHIRLERRNYPMRKSLINWIDDHLGRTYDTAIAPAEAIFESEMEPQY